jgi:hypothetical protein
MKSNTWGEQVLKITKGKTRSMRKTKTKKVLILSIGKYLIDSEWKIFNRHRMLVIDGKYNNEDGMNNR